MLAMTSLVYDSLAFPASPRAAKRASPVHQMCDAECLGFGLGLGLVCQWVELDGMPTKARTSFAGMKHQVEFCRVRRAYPQASDSTMIP